jgi:hypothetical protein
MTRDFIRRSRNGNLEYAGGVALCTQCRDKDEGADVS